MEQWKIELEKKEQIKKAMDQLKMESAEELGIALEKTPDDNATAREIGSFAGPVGGQMVKKMVAEAQKMLAEQNSK